MRHPFYMDRLGSQDRKNVKWLMVRVLAGYLSLVVLVVGGAMVKAKFIDPQTEPMHQKADAR
jgi:hypothetical protein